MKSGLISATALVLMAVVTSAQRQRCQPKSVAFEKGASSTMIKRQLEPCDHLIYKFQARAGQKMRVELRPESNDVVFLVQGTKFLPAPTYSFVVEGIHKNGVTDWKGVLPNDDIYEIWVRRPAVSNSNQKRTLPFRLFVEIK